MGPQGWCPQGLGFAGDPTQGKGCRPSFDLSGSKPPGATDLATSSPLSSASSSSSPTSSSSSASPPCDHPVMTSPTFSLTSLDSPLSPQQAPQAFPDLGPSGFLGTGGRQGAPLVPRVITSVPGQTGGAGFSFVVSGGRSLAAAVPEGLQSAADANDSYSAFRPIMGCPAGSAALTFADPSHIKPPGKGSKVDPRDSSHPLSICQLTGSSRGHQARAGTIGGGNGNVTF